MLESIIKNEKGLEKLCELESKNPKGCAYSCEMNKGIYVCMLIGYETKKHVCQFQGDYTEIIDVTKLYQCKQKTR